MTFRMPTFHRDRTLDGNYASLLMALGLLSEDAPGVTRENAEAELKRLMPSFILDGQTVEVGPGKFKTAAFFCALSKVKGTTSFTLSAEDIKMFWDYLTQAILEDADTNPEKHSTVTMVRQKGTNTQIIVNLAAVA
jgi:hypothetical protein